MEALDPIFEQKNSTIAKDLRINLSRLLDGGNLTQTQAHLALLALATSLNIPILQNYAKKFLTENSIPQDQIQEASETAAIMGMLNMYYRFKHFITHGSPEAAEYYQTAGLRMMSLGRPALGKQVFEMLAFAVSVLNGCEYCVCAHEKALREQSVTTDQIHDLARLASVAKGLEVLLR